MSRKRSKKAAVPGEELLLFEVPKPATSADDPVPKVVRCSECNTLLRSERSKAAGVSERCAAQVGVAVLATMRKAKARAAPAA
ncbi:hypothetical protein [Streptomyces sp. NPDC047070]|uniref:hypothetical protein n=1 Tax=Streptomyces sp. NPDC047070 TaxID=3154923 RepID=UPI0034534B91